MRLYGLQLTVWLLVVHPFAHAVLTNTTPTFVSVQMSRSPLIASQMPVPAALEQGNPSAPPPEHVDAPLLSSVHPRGQEIATRRALDVENTVFSSAPPSVLSRRQYTALTLVAQKPAFANFAGHALPSRAPWKSHFVVVPSELQPPAQSYALPRCGAETIGFTHSKTERPSALQMNDPIGEQLSPVFGSYFCGAPHENNTTTTAKAIRFMARKHSRRGTR